MNGGLLRSLDVVYYKALVCDDYSNTHTVYRENPA